MSTEALATNVLSEEERLESLLTRRLGSRIRDLRVILSPGGLILQGRTATYHAKQLAQHAAMEVADQPILANEIEVPLADQAGDARSREAAGSINLIGTIAISCFFFPFVRKSLIQLIEDLLHSYR